MMCKGQRQTNKQKHPAGPETVLGKTHFFCSNEYGTVVKREFISSKTSKKWIPKFGRFRVLPQ